MNNNMRSFEITRGDDSGGPIVGTCFEEALGKLIREDAIAYINQQLNLYFDDTTAMEDISDTMLREKTHIWEMYIADYVDTPVYTIRELPTD